MRLIQRLYQSQLCAVLSERSKDNICPRSPIRIQGTKQQEKQTRAVVDCGSVGRAVASDTRGPWFKSSHQRNSYMNMFTVNC